MEPSPCGTRAHPQAASSAQERSSGRSMPCVPERGRRVSCLHMPRGLRQLHPAVVTTTTTKRTFQASEVSTWKAHGACTRSQGSRAPARSPPPGPPSRLILSPRRRLQTQPHPQPHVLRTLSKQVSGHNCCMQRRVGDTEHHSFHDLEHQLVNCFSLVMSSHTPQQHIPTPTP